MRRSASLLLAMVAALMAGCAGYQLGPTHSLAPRSSSVQVNLFRNDTQEPRLGEAVANALRKALQQDGTYRLDTRDQGDLVVSGIITEMNRQNLSYQPNDVITGRDYRLLLVARLTVTDRRTGKVVLDRQIAGRTKVAAVSDLASAERQAVPLAAEDLARQATSLLADGQW
jgi:hypothetical protein